MLSDPESLPKKQASGMNEGKKNKTAKLPGLGKFHTQ